ILNVCCCLWVVVGGVLTTYLLQQGRPMAVEGSEAALAGLIAGVVGALISVMFLFVVHSVSGGAMEAQFRDMVEQFPQISPEARDQGLALISGPGFVLLSALVTIPAYAVIGMLG